jgi:2-dehydro-3-deoxyphosphooctonate aldolase (KDO 8-P synthase)
MDNRLKPLFAGQDYDPANFFLIAGPCVVENEEVLNTIAQQVSGICKKFRIPFVFKSSYRKANRTSGDSFTGIGDIPALELLASVGKKFGLRLVSDIHSSEEAVMAAKYLDMLQIPAFLCRQTDLLVAAAKTGKFVNVKKGQFVSGEAMKFAVDKIRNAGNDNILLTERGTTFGYNDLVVDMRNIPAMKTHGVPVVMDVTHSLQKPNLGSGVTGGDPGMIETIAKSAIAAGADGLFIETHPDPANAKSDGANMLSLDKMETLLEKLVKLRAAL